MSKPKILLTFILLFFLGKVSLFAQGSSNVGKEFWVAYAGHFDRTNSRLTLFITSKSNSVVNITAGGVALSPVNIIANQAVPVYIDPAIYGNAYVDGSDVVQSNAGIYITADQPIIVYSHISFSARSAASLILPIKALGNEYITMSYKQSSGPGPGGNPYVYSEFTVVGIENATTVEITPSQNSINNTKTAGTPFQVILNKGDVYQYQSNTDISGTVIKSVGGCKPLAVFSGSTFTAFCQLGNNSAGSGDNLYQQLFPTTAWGKIFYTVPFNNVNKGSTDIIRIIAAKDNTNITVNGSLTDANGTPLSNPYAKGSIITFNSTIANVIKADQPVSVAQLQTTQSCNPNHSTANPIPGDPDMTILSPIEQTLTDITLYSAINVPAAPTNITSHFINIICKTADISNLRLDGAAINQSFTVIDAIYSYVIVDVTASSALNPAHRITSSEGFVALAYGYGSAESYAYLAGADAKNLDANIKLFLPGSNNSTENLCLGEDYKVKLKLPYETTRIIWNLNNGEKIEIINPAASTSSETIGGITSYFYDYEISGSNLTVSGNQNLKATALNPNPTSCSADEEIISDFEVFTLPVANFTEPDSLCLNSMISFTDSSTTLNGSTISAYLWDFNGEGTSGVKNPSFSFNMSGYKDIKLSVKSDEGCWSDIFTRQIYINQDPLPDFSFSAPACPNNEIQFTDLSTAIDGLVNSRLWDFGDGTTSTEQNPRHTYTTVQSYAVSLTIITNLGCSKTILKDVNINPLPVIDFSTPDICLRDAFVTFVNNTTIADNTEMQYLWDFGDPSSGALNISTDKDGFHTYSRAENYTITLKVISLITGCETTLTKPFTVNGSSPEPAFSVLNENMLCSDQPVIFLDSASVDFGEITKIEWYFDYENKQTPDITDTDPASRSDPARQYTWTYPQFQSPISKNYKVRMVAYSGLTCVEEIDRVIILKAVPDIIFDSIPAICQEVLPFRINQAKENSGFAGREIFTGRGISSDGIFSPSIAGPGIHNINYKFIAENGCEQELNQNIIVYPSPEVDAGADQTILIGGQIQLNSVTSGDILSYRWTPATGLSRTDITNPIAFPTDSITYTLEVITTNGCNKIDRIFVNVLQKPIIPNTFTPNNDNINDKWEIKYLDSYNQVSVNVFNRYGKIVYRTNSYTESWDGNLKGEELPTGVYYYIITANNNTLKYTGSVTIIR